MFGFFRKSDKNNILPKVTVQIRSHFTSRPELQPAVIKSVSLVSEGLCSWVRAVEVWGKVAKVTNLSKDFAQHHPFILLNLYKQSTARRMLIRQMTGTIVWRYFRT